MTETLKLMCIFAHPDDESMGTGGMLAKYAAEGVETYVISATRGERGWQGAPEDNPGLQALGQQREGELHAAAALLGVHEVIILDYIDGDLDQANPVEVTSKLVSHIRRVRPHVIVTFDPFGAYGHPDHIAICQLTSAAVVAAADADYPAAQTWPPHRVAKLYYLAETASLYDLYFAAFGEIVMEFDGVERRGAPWVDWAVTTRLDTSMYWRQASAAIAAHQSQVPDDLWQSLSESFHQQLWREQTFYRALSFVNGGRAIEDDLFAGLR